MSYISRLFIFIVCVAVSAFSGYGGNTTKYSKVNVTASPSAKGSVYVSASQTSSPAYAATSSATNNSTENFDHTYYLYAKPVDGQDFLGWFIGSDVVSPDPEHTVVVTAVSEDKSKPTEMNYTARFGMTPAVTVATNNGKVNVNPMENKIGQKVTLTAKQEEHSEQTPNFAKVFDGWFDEDNNLVSTENPYTFTIEKPGRLTARWSTRLAVKGNGYFRVGSYFNGYLKVIGDMDVDIKTNTVTTLDSDLEWLRHPLAHMYAYDPANTANKNGYADPATIMYIEGETVAAAAENYNYKDVLMKNVTINAQGVKTSQFFKGVAQGATMDMQWGPMEGQYRFVFNLSRASLVFKWQWSTTIDAGSVIVGEVNDDQQEAMVLYPVDEANADMPQCWFAAFPADDMMHDGGYWSSMFTSFPYKCLEEDGVEAYYVSRLGQYDGEVIAVVVKIEDGIVPPATPVLLKSPRLIDTTAYMSVKGASPEPANRLIPLLPSDELTAKAAEIAEVNLLSGEYQLNHNDNADKGHVFYDAQTMRVLGVNGAGEVGFYKLKDTDGKPSELAANRAYLNLGGTATRAASIRIVDADCSGVEEIAVDGDLNNADNACYDLYGRPVNHMVPGNIYISKGRKIIAR